MIFHILISHPQNAQFYCPTFLCAKDLHRLTHHPKLNEQISWRNSRALKTYVTSRFPNQKFCLTHKLNYAAIAMSDDKKPGLDLEFFKQRDFHSLIENVGNPKEISHIKNHPEDFYRLWTLKEATIKAEDLRFPTDMHRVGISYFQPTWQLAKTTSHHYFWVSLLLDNAGYLSAIWPVNEIPQTAELHIHLPKDYQTTAHHLISNVKNIEINYLNFSLNNN